MANVMRDRRAALGLSQADLAAAVGLDKRQIRRYEAGEAQPTLVVAKAIAHALQISLDELAGETEQRLQITGDWWAGWQTWKDGAPVHTSQPVQIRQRGTDLDIAALERGISTEEGGYLWRGQLRLWDNEILMGWYAADDQAVRSKGTLYLVIHPARTPDARPLGRSQLRRTDRVRMVRDCPDRAGGARPATSPHRW